MGRSFSDRFHRRSRSGNVNMSVEKQNFICRAYSRVFVGLFLDWVSNGMKEKDLDCFSDACILVEGGIEEP
ncbi:MAG: TetR-like C-terminal domain-containing protein [Clostridium fessum]